MSEISHIDSQLELSEDQRTSIFTSEKDQKFAQSLVSSHSIFFGLCKDISGISIRIYFSSY